MTVLEHMERVAARIDAMKDSKDRRNITLWLFGWATGAALRNGWTLAELQRTIASPEVERAKQEIDATDD